MKPPTTHQLPPNLTHINHLKKLEHIITSNIMQHLDTHNILHNTQHGFRKHRSTETHLIQLIENLAHNIDNKLQTDAILLDFQKKHSTKFPTSASSKNSNTMASHHKHSTGYIHSYLTAHSRSSWRAICLPPSTSLLESPKEVFLGPILFLIYINHLPDYIQNNSTVKLFADDTIIYHPIANQQDSNALQEDLDALQRWESD